MGRAAGLVLAVAALANAAFWNGRFVARLLAADAGLASVNPSSLVYVGIRALTVTLAGLLAIFIFARLRSTRDRLAIGFCMASFALVRSDEGGFALLRWLSSAGGVVVPEVVWHALYTGLVILALSTFLRWSQVFPDGPGRPPAVGGTGQGVLARILDSPTTPVAAAVAMLSIFVAGDLWLDYGARISIQIVISLLVAFAVTRNFMVSFRRGDAATRQRIYWVAAAAVVATVLLTSAVWAELAFHVFGVRTAAVVWMHALLAPLALAAGIALIGFAIFFRGALDTSVVLHRSVVYGGMVVVLTAVFVTVEAVLSQALLVWIGLPASVGAWTGAFIVALAFGPLRRAADSAVDRLIARIESPAVRAPSLDAPSLHD